MALPKNNKQTMPPPPLPAFLVPKHPLIHFAQNDSKLCYAAYMCETLPGPRIQNGIEFIELSGHNLNDAWLFVAIALLVGVILLIIIVTFTFIKCREYVSDFIYSYYFNLCIFLEFLIR